MLNPMEQKDYTYSVILTPAEEGGFTVTVPSLPGCITEGDTYEEAMTNAREAIGLTLACLEAHGDVVPRETGSPVVSNITIAPRQYA